MASPERPDHHVQIDTTCAFISRLSMTKRFFASLALLFLTLAALRAQAPAGKEELKLKLPKPMFIGTPTNLKSANLEKITGKPRGPFYVPKGTVLLSLKKSPRARALRLCLEPPAAVPSW